MPDEAKGEKRNVIVLKNQSYDMTCRLSVLAQYAEAVKTYMLVLDFGFRIAECGLKNRKQKAKILLLPSAFYLLISALQNPQSEIRPSAID